MPRICPNCGQNTVSRYRLQDGSTTYICSNCGQEYPDQQELGTQTGIRGRRRRAEEALTRAEEEAWTEEGRRREERQRAETEEVQRIRQRRAHRERVERADDIRRRRIGPPPENLPGLFTDARSTGLIAQGLGWFIGGLVISALLGSWLLFLAFLCWAVNSIIRMPQDPIRQRIDRITNRYNQLLQRARTDRSREILLQQRNADTEIEAVMARVLTQGEHLERSEMNRQWQRSFKAGLNVLAFALLVIGVVYTTLPGAGLLGLIISFAAYFMLRGRQ